MSDELRSVLVGTVGLGVLTALGLCRTIARAGITPEVERVRTALKAANWSVCLWILSTTVAGSSLRSSVRSVPAGLPSSFTPKAMQPPPEFANATISLTSSHQSLPVRKEDMDFPMSWVRRQGKGRVFYTGLGHSAQVFWNAPLLDHLLAGIQYALGDLPADDAADGTRRQEAAR